MQTLLDDDAFAAAMSFLDEYASEEADTEETEAPDGQEELAQKKSAEFLCSRDDKLQKKKALNEKRKMLRKLGVYADPNRSRSARKKEIAFLREQLQKLEHDLNAIQSRANGNSEGRVEEGGERMAMVPKVWQEMAAHQRRQRADAEDENIRLKLAADQQQKVADSLRSLLRKRATHLIKEYSALTANSGHYIDRVLDFRGDIGDFQALFRHLDAAKLELDTMLVNNGLANMTISLVDVHIREHRDGKYMEFFTYKELPFRVQETTEVSWDHWKGMEKHIMGNGGLYQKTAKNLDQPYTIVEDFTKELYSKSARADVQVKQVVRRYVEADRDVIIWVARLVPAEIKHKMLRGLTYNLRGQVVIKRSPHSTPDQEVAVLQQCSLIYLDQESRHRYDPSSLRTLTKFLVIHAAQNQRAHREIIENTLLDRSIACSSKLTYT
ncbi:hypothetical protein V7S43_001493 [Phytophthora oleae]|uniref:M96 mating-specific protein family n=1 Tax=Phytophthora oleae TaxID=2107226 RepID=A0ABD3G5F0_9STRA